MSDIFFTSDTHFGHANIITYSNRPFSSVEDMNEKLIENWNKRVSIDSVVYHLGDFAMGPRQNIYLRQKLNGKITLIKGNHDRSTAAMLQAGFDKVYKNLTIEVDGYKLYLAHIPAHIPDPSSRKYESSLIQAPPVYYDYYLCGHVHTQWKRIGKTINVGVDVSDFVPLTLSELLARDI